MPADFIDTNVLLYLLSDDPVKAGRAEQLVRQGGTISVQVLNEIANVGRRKMRLSWAELRGFLATIRALLRVVPLTLEVHDLGLAVAERYGLATFDALLVASALESGCDRLWSEDMQHGMAVEERLRIVNPFLP